MITIIMPMYNSSKSIQNTLNSFVNQTSKDFELIIVDDKSSDNSVELANIYKDKINLQIYTKDHEGLCKAVSYGIKHASGDYIASIDSDDTIDDKYIETMNKIKDGFDFITIGYNVIKDNKKVGEVHLPNKEYTSKEELKELINTFYINNHHFTCFQNFPVYRWSSLIKASIVKSIVEQYSSYNFSWYEDLVFKYLCLVNSSSVKTVDYQGVNYYQTSSSLSKRNNIDFKFLIDLRVKLRAFLREFSLKYNLNEDIFQTMEFDVSKLYLTRIIRSNNYKDSKRFYKQLKKDDLYKNQIKLVTVKGEPIKRKLYFYFLKYKLFLLLFISFKHFVV